MQRAAYSCSRGCHQGPEPFWHLVALAFAVRHHAGRHLRSEFRPRSPRGRFGGSGSIQGLLFAAAGSVRRGSVQGTEELPCLCRFPWIAVHLVGLAHSGPHPPPRAASFVLFRPAVFHCRETPLFLWGLRATSPWCRVSARGVLMAPCERQETSKGDTGVQRGAFLGSRAGSGLAARVLLSFAASYFVCRVLLSFAVCRFPCAVAAIGCRRKPHAPPRPTVDRRRQGFSAMAARLVRSESGTDKMPQNRHVVARACAMFV